MRFPGVQQGWNRLVNGFEETCFCRLCTRRKGFFNMLIQIMPMLGCPNLGPVNGFFWQEKPPSFPRNPCCGTLSAGLCCKGPYTPVISQLQGYPLLSLAHQERCAPVSSYPVSLTHPDKILLLHTQNLSQVGQHVSFLIHKGAFLPTKPFTPTHTHSPLSLQKSGM